MASRVLVFLFFYLAAVSCSEETNVNQLVVSSEQKEALDSLLFRAEQAYDKGEFNDAVELAEKAKRLAPESPEVDILLGYINLSLAGMDTFKIASALIKAQKKESTNLVATTSNDTAKLMKTLKDVLELDDAALETIADRSTSSDLEYFKDHDVLIPKTVTEARASQLGLFVHIDAAVKAVCRWVSDEVNLDDDSRHNIDDCKKSEIPSDIWVRAHALWAFAHIAEAVGYYSVILFQEDDQDLSNIELRVNNLDKNKDTMGISSYVSHVTTLASNVTSIFDTADSDSQLNGILNNLTTASKAFEQLPNIPDKVKKALNKALKAIEDKKNQVSGSTDEQKESSALQNQITEEISKNLDTQISELARSNPDEFNENKTEICEAYETIAAGGSTPEECL